MQLKRKVSTSSKLFIFDMIIQQRIGNPDPLTKLNKLKFITSGYAVIVRLYSFLPIQNGISRNIIVRREIFRYESLE